MAEEAVFAPNWIGVLGPFVCGSIVALVVLGMIIIWIFVSRTNAAGQQELDALRVENTRLREENERLKKKLAPADSTDIKAI
jgi:hypothetical protein